MTGSDDKKSSKNDWDFELKLENSPSEKKTLPKKTAIDIAREKSGNQDKLVLEKNKPKTISRVEMAKVAAIENNEVEDLVHENFSSGARRFAAHLIDAIVIGVVSYLVKMVLLFSKLIPSDFSGFLVLGSLNFAIYFLFICFPMAFFNRTLGKKMVGIYVYGDNSFNLSMMRVFLREFILKPISILSVIGIVVLFFNKKRKTLHDFILKTVVVDATQN